MTRAIDRQLIAQLLIVLGLTVGGWLILVAPKVDLLRKVEAEIEAQEGTPVLLEQATIERLAGRLEVVRSQLVDIEQKNAMAQDSSRMYVSLMDLAEEAGVTVLQIQPGRAKGSDGDDTVNYTQVHVTVEGLFEQVTDFLDSVNTMPGFVRPRQLTVTPLDHRGRDLVLARFTCEALWFGLPTPLTELTGGPSDAS